MLNTTCNANKLITSLKPKTQSAKLTSQAGFTMIEILIATAVTAILSTGLIMVTFQVFSTNAAITNHNLAIKQVQNAVDYISRDVQQAQPTSPLYSWDGSNLTFTLTTSSNGVTYTNQNVVYTVSNGTLTRKVGTGQAQNIATNISSSGFTVNTAGTPYVSITSTVTGFSSVTETRVVLLMR